MGLDSFDSSKDEASSDETPSQDVGDDKSGQAANGPSFTTATFSDDSMATPRSIKYYAKHGGSKWASQFSRMRIDAGEVVLFSAGLNTSKDGVTVAVFTTILSEFDEPLDGEQKPIWVVPWDLNEREPLVGGAMVHPDGDWESQLSEMVCHYLDTIDEYSE